MSVPTPCAGIYDPKLSAEPEAGSRDDALLVLPPSQLLPGCAGSRVPYTRHALYTRHATCVCPCMPPAMLEDTTFGRNMLSTGLSF